MKQTIARIAILSAFAGLSAKAAPFMAVGDNAELFVTASAQVQADDNIYLNTTNKASDTIMSFTPGLDLVFGKGSATKGNAYYREEIRRYNDHSQQNTDLSNLGFKSNFDNGVSKADFNASYAQVAQNDNQVKATGDIVHRQLTNVGAHGEFTFSEKSSLGVGLTYDKTNYGPATFSDSDIWTLPLDVYFKATPKLDWSAGYRYRNTALSGNGVDSKDHFFNVGARGEFSPKLTGQLRVGYTDRSYDKGGSDSSFGLDGSVAYAFSEKTNYQLTASNDFGSAGTGESTKNFSLGLNTTTKISEEWSFTGGISYRKIEYPTRTDKYIEGLLAVTYNINAIVNLGASYTYRDNMSNLASAEFKNNVFTFGANVRY